MESITYGSTAPGLADDGPRRILVVEDSPEYAALVEQMLLEGFDYEIDVVRAETLSVAERILSGAASVDGVLLDLSLPDASGLAGLGAIQRAAPDAPVVVLTGGGDRDLGMRALREGAQDYLPKTGTDAALLARALRYAIERKRADLRLSQAQATAEREVREVEALSRAKDSFLSSMSHELRTPLHAILGFTELLLEGSPGSLNNDQGDMLETIQSSGNHLLSLVNDVLDLARIQAGTIELNIEPVECMDLLEDVAAGLMPLAQQKGIRLEVVAERGLVMVCDRRALTQILINLVNNAIKFTDEGSIHLMLSRGDDDGRTVTRFTVVDTGRGIAITDQGKLFSAFQQIGSSAGGDTEGTGLGLSISRALARQLGGSITFESEVGKGSTFTLEAPEARSPGLSRV